MDSSIESRDDLSLEKRGRRQRRASSDLLNRSRGSTKSPQSNKSGMLSKLSFSTELLSQPKGNFDLRKFFLFFCKKKDICKQRKKML